MRRRVRPLRREVPSVDRRPPEVRLATVLSERNPERRQRIFRQIRNDDHAEPATWIGAARTLHGAGTITRDVYWYFVTMFLDDVMDRMHDQDPELLRLSDEMRAIEASHGLDEDDSFFIDEGPADWREANASWERRAGEIVRGYLREHGFNDVADEMEHRREEFDACSSVGWREVWPESTSDWR